MRFLVSRTVSFRDRDPWPGDTDIVDELDYVESRFSKFPRRLQELAQRWYEFQYALSLLRRCRGYDGVAVGRYGIWFPVLQRLLGLRRRVVMTDIEWKDPRGGRVNRAASLASAAVCCMTRAEIEMYSRLFKIPHENFVLVPLAFQRGDICSAKDDGYVFAGGTQGRDWDTFVKAVDGLPYQIKVFTNRRLPYIPANTTVGFVSREQFYAHMAAASCVVMTLNPEPARIPGTTTWTAAMAMGKVVIVAEPRGAPDYMEQGVSGFYVNYGDAEALRYYIDLVMKDSELRKRVGEAARERAWREFSPDVFRRRVLSLLEGEAPVLA